MTNSFSKIVTSIKEMSEHVDVHSQKYEKYRENFEEMKNLPFVKKINQKNRQLKKKNTELLIVIEELKDLIINICAKKTKKSNLLKSKLLHKKKIKIRPI